MLSSLRDAPFVEGKGGIRMGLRPVERGGWLSLGNEFTQRIQIKKHLIQQHRDRVLASLPGTEMVQRELLEEVIQHLQTFHANQVKVEEDRITTLANASGYSFSEFRERPLELLSYLVEEDLCVLLENNDQFLLVAGSVCSPSWWDLKTKLGADISEIHSPVYTLEEKIGRMVRHFFKQLKPGNIYTRANWFIWPSEHLCLFPNSFDVERRFQQTAQHEVGEKIYIRTERQTIRRLASSNMLVFGIRVSVHPLKMLERDTALAVGLDQALRGLDEHEKEYRGYYRYADKVHRYLEEVING